MWKLASTSKFLFGSSPTVTDWLVLDLSACNTESITGLYIEVVVQGSRVRIFSHSLAVLSYVCVHFWTLERGQYQIQLYCMIAHVM